MVGETRDQLVGARVGRDVQMPRRLGAGGHRRRGHVPLDAGLRIRLRGGAPAVGPAVELGQQHAQDRRLQLVEAGVVADVLERLLVARAMEAQRAG